MPRPLSPARLLTILTLTLATAASPRIANAEAPVVPPRSGPSETTRLFDGKTLDGWAGHFRYWSVKDGEIVGKSSAPVPVSTYLLTEKNYTDFRLTAKGMSASSDSLCGPGVHTGAGNQGAGNSVSPARQVRPGEWATPLATPVSRG